MLSIKKILYHPKLQQTLIIYKFIPIFDIWYKFLVVLNNIILNYCNLINCVIFKTYCQDLFDLWFTSLTIRWDIFESHPPPVLLMDQPSLFKNSYRMTSTEVTNNLWQDFSLSIPKYNFLVIFYFFHDFFIMLKRVQNCSQVQVHSLKNQWVQILCRTIRNNSQFNFQM